MRHCLASIFDRRAHAQCGARCQNECSHDLSGFLHARKSGDTDIPILKEAKAEYAKLK